MVPSWWFERNVLAPAVIDSLADMFLGLDQDVDDQVANTYILQAVAQALDEHGFERGVDRLRGEVDAAYRRRVQRITSQTDKVDIKAAVDEILIQGECTILESPADAPFCSRGSFVGRSSFILGFGLNEFLVLVPKQQHSPYSFCSRSLYCSRDSFAGTTDLVTDLYASIIATINRLKAFGVMYGVVETE